jgi:glucans biosynthesis protein
MRTSLPLPFGNTLALTLLLALAGPAGAAGFGFDDVAKRAQALAAKSYQAPDAKLPPVLRDMGYDAYRDIRFLADHALWRNAGLPFEVQFFHPGFLFQQPVAISVVTAHGVKPVRFDPDAFTYGRNDIDRKALRKLQHAGFRIHYALNRPDYKDEVAVFLGASYFRAVGKGQGYGLSARGLAVDTALPSGEEFPAFREFWIEWPAPHARELVIHALLDSPRATGAYRFVIRPGETTALDVRARLFLRDGVGKLGLAPLSSMYFFGENQPAPAEDFRPEVHDSDGLLLAAAGGEWLWRPLVNPRRLLITSLAQVNPRGFGLLQRDRDFAHYQDLEARYERRPSAWIEPQGDWGPGHVELVQIPTGNEFNDNVVAYWVPGAPPAPGRPYDFAYRLSWQADSGIAPLGRVLQTRRGQAGKDTVRFIVEFGGGALDALAPDAPPGLSAWCNERGELLEQRLQRNAAVGGWRAVLTVRRTEDEPVELRVQLRSKDGPVSETWSYVWPLI